MQEILQSISADFFEKNEPHEIDAYVANNFFGPEVLRTKWLGYPPASQQAIVEREEQLNIVLPPSYKVFLVCSNGFRFLSPFWTICWLLKKLTGQEIPRRSGSLL